MKNYGWDEEHPVHVKKDWKYEVANDDTLLGYDEWVANKSEVETPQEAAIGTRTIHLPIAPATERTCGDGTGAFCPWTRTEKFGTRFICQIWGPLRDEDGWLQRHSECLAKESSKVREVEAPHKAIIRWGSEMTREDNEGVSSGYSFETNIELEAFMRGVEEAIGWSDYEIVEDEGSVTNRE